MGKFKWRIIFFLVWIIAAVSAAICLLSIISLVIYATINDACTYKPLEISMVVSIVISIICSLNLNWTHRKAIKEENKEFNKKCWDDYYKNAIKIKGCQDEENINKNT